MSVNILRPSSRILTLGDMGTMQIFGIGQGAANWWEAGGASGCVAAYQPKGAASLADSYTDLTGNGNDAAPGVAPAWDATNGWKFNGSTHYLDTGIVVSSGTWSALCQFTSYTSSGDYHDLFGAYGGSGDNFAILPYYDAGGSVRYLYGVGAQRLEAAPPLTAGNLGIVGGLGGFRNGISDGAIATGNPPSLSIYLAAEHKIGEVGNFAAVYIQAWAIYNNALTAAQVAAVAAAMAALP